MPDEGFLRRWARLKADPAAAEAVAAPAQVDARKDPVAAPAVAPQPARLEADPAPALPTLDDAARLDASSDFSAFVSKGVDKEVRRLAMKKLFSDPHFNLVDKLDVYMDDYNKLSPMSAEMLAALHHTKNLFAPLAADVEAAAAAEAAAIAADDFASQHEVVPAEAGTHAGSPESYDGNQAADAESAEPLAQDDGAILDANSATTFDIAAPSGVQQPQQGNA